MKKALVGLFGGLGLLVVFATSGCGDSRWRRQRGRGARVLQRYCDAYIAKACADRPSTRRRPSARRRSARYTSAAPANCNAAVKAYYDCRQTQADLCADDGCDSQVGGAHQRLYRDARLAPSARGIASCSVGGRDGETPARCGPNCDIRVAIDRDLDRRARFHRAGGEWVAGGAARRLSKRSRRIRRRRRSTGRKSSSRCHGRRGRSDRAGSSGGITPAFSSAAAESSSSSIASTPTGPSTWRRACSAPITAAKSAPALCSASLSPTGGSPTSGSAADSCSAPALHPRRDVT